MLTPTLEGAATLTQALGSADAKTEGKIKAKGLYYLRSIIELGSHISRSSY